MTKPDSFANYRQHYPGRPGSDHTWAGRLHKIARTVPDSIAFIQGDRRVTWKEFDLRTNRLANALLGLGLGKEDRVAIMGFNSIEWMESYFAISKLGAVPVNLNPRFVPQELKHVLEDSDAAALILEPDYLDRIQEIRPELPRLKHVIVMGDPAPADLLGYEALMTSHPDTPPRLGWPVNDDDFAFLFYTGGTTGYPKGTVWDGFNRVRGLDAIMITAMGPLVLRLPDLSSEALAALKDVFPVPLPEGLVRSRLFRWIVNQSVGSEFADRLSMRLIGSRLFYRLMAGKMKLVVVAPLFHGTAYETDFSMIGANAGTSIFLERPQPFNPAELWETVVRHRANLIVIVGDAFAIPMAEELERKDYDLRSLAAIISSGVRWSPAAKKRLLGKNPGLVLLDELGSTETSAAFTQVSSAQDQDISLLKIKIVIQGINQARVINPLTGADVQPGEKGELIFGGFNALGYWKDPERTARCFRELDGRRWFHVGDEGTVDEEGFFHFLGRGSSIINTGGEKVYAEEVEEILLQHSGVRDVGVTGVPDPRWGEAVTAVIEPAQDADLVPEEIVDFCRNKMAGYKKPRHVLFVRALPRSAAAKLERKALKEMAAKMVTSSPAPGTGSKGG